MTQTGANNRGTDQSTPSHSLKGLTDADQPAHTWSSANNNSPDQSAHLQNLEPIIKVVCEQWRSRSACTFVQAQNNGADQPAHLHGLRLVFSMLTNAGPTRINNIG